MKIFLAPRSNGTSYKNFQSTIESGIDYAIIEPYLTSQGRIALDTGEKLFAWGNKETKKTSWSKMEKGDIVLFYKKGAFVYAGRLLYKQHSKDLSLKLWPAKKNSEPWTCIFFLKDITRINISVKEFNNISGGQYKFGRVQGFMPVKQSVCNLILKKFGTAEAFVEKYKDGSIETTRTPEENLKNKTMATEQHGTAFEQEVVAMFQQLEFENVDGARNNFLLGGVQVDAVAGWQNILIVVECTTKKNLGKKKDLSEKISSFRGKMELIKRGVVQHEKYKKYTKIWFVLATKNIDIREVDKELARQEPKIYLWYNDFLAYYADLYRYLRPYAKYDLLGELGVKPAHHDQIRVPAFRAEINGVVVYTFLMNPRALLEVSFVARRERGSEQYYQRIINEERLGKIAAYIKQGGVFPNNIILAFRERLPVSFDEIPVTGGVMQEKNIAERKKNTAGSICYGMLSFPNDFRSCWIIDGQHRLYAFAALPESADFVMPITAFESLPISEQRRYFLDINRNQKPVDSDLLWDLSSDVLESKEGIIANAVKYLNTHWQSPLHGLIYYPSTGIFSKKGRLKISALCIALKKNRIADTHTSQNMTNLLTSTNPQKHYTNIARNLMIYLNSVKEIFPKNWELGSRGFVLSSGGMSVMLAFFERILSRKAERSQLPSPEDYATYLKPLTQVIELRNQPAAQKQLRLKTTSEAGKKELVDELSLIARRETGDGRFGGDIVRESNDRGFTELEKLLKELIRKTFETDEDEWLSGLVEEAVYFQAMKITEKNFGRQDPQKAYLSLTMGQCFSLLHNNFAKVHDVFINDEEYSFSNPKEFQTAGMWIGKMRAVMDSHYTGAKIKQSDVEILIPFMNKVRFCIQSALDGSFGQEDSGD